MTDIINIIVKNINEGANEEERIDAKTLKLCTMAFLGFMLLAVLIP